MGGAAGKAGAVAGIGGSVIGGIQQLRESQVQADTLKDNASIADQIADQALFRGEHEAARRALEVGQAKGTQRAAIADAGFDPNFGTSLDILADTAAVGASDAVLIRYNSALEAWRARNQSTDFRNQADLIRWAAPIKAVAGVAQSAGRSSALQRTTLGGYEPPYVSRRTAMLGGSVPS